MQDEIDRRADDMQDQRVAVDAVPAFGRRAERLVFGDRERVHVPDAATTQIASAGMVERMGALPETVRGEGEDGEHPPDRIVQPLVGKERAVAAIVLEGEQAHQQHSGRQRQHDRAPVTGLNGKQDHGAQGQIEGQRHGQLAPGTPVDGIAVVHAMTRKGTYGIVGLGKARYGQVGISTGGARRAVGQASVPLCTIHAPIATGQAASYHPHATTGGGTVWRKAETMKKDYPETPDGRYFVSKGRLWRKTNPALGESERRAAVKALMQARRAVRFAAGDADMRQARDAVDAAKRTLGERGPVWWDDGAPDENRKAPWNSSHAEWWAGLDERARQAGLGKVDKTGPE